VEGVSVEPRAEASRGKTFPCEACGAELEYSIGAGQLRCPFCGHAKQLAAGERPVAEQDLPAMLARQRERRASAREAEPALREVRCSGCGATVRFHDTLTATTCAYCGTALVLDEIHDAERRVPVDGVLPFTVESAAAKRALAAWVKSRWFAPNSFLRLGIEGRLHGVYLPFWTFDAMTDTSYTGMRGDHYWVTVGSGKNRRRVRHTRWSPAAGRFQRFFDDVLVVAATGLSKERLVALEPWPLGGLRPYAPDLLAGFLARTYDVELEPAFAEGRTLIDARLRDDVRSRIGGDVQRIESMDTGYDALTYKHLLLPVWLTALRFKQRSYQVLVNATTGEVQGDRPYSWAKIALTILAALAVAAVAAWLRR